MPLHAFAATCNLHSLRMQMFHSTSALPIPCAQCIEHNAHKHLKFDGILLYIAFNMTISGAACTLSLLRPSLPVDPRLHSAHAVQAGACYAGHHSSWYYSMYMQRLLDLEPQALACVNSGKSQLSTFNINIEAFM